MEVSAHGFMHQQRGKGSLSEYPLKPPRTGESSSTSTWTGRTWSAPLYRKNRHPLPDLMGSLLHAVENPFGGKKLSELLAGARKVAIITENQFRAAPDGPVSPVAAGTGPEGGCGARYPDRLREDGGARPGRHRTQARTRGCGNRGRDTLQQRKKARELCLQGNDELRRRGVGAPQSGRGRRDHHHLDHPGNSLGLRGLGDDHPRGRGERHHRIQPRDVARPRTASPATTIATCSWTSTKRPASPVFPWASI